MSNLGKSLTSGRKTILRLVLALVLVSSVVFARGETVTNLQQLTELMDRVPRTNCAVRLEGTVCAASQPSTGVLILQDESGVELLELGGFEREIRPGERVLIEGKDCLLRSRENGVEISVRPVVDNDGVHYTTPRDGNVTLKAGLNPIRLDWFISLGSSNLFVRSSLSGEPLRFIKASNLWHEAVAESGRLTYMPGLQAEVYEGYWESVPDFSLLQPVKVSVVTNVSPGSATHANLVGIRFTGFYNAPRDGDYTFQTESHDGSLLFLGKPELPIVQVGITNPPVARPGFYAYGAGRPQSRRWVSIEGKVIFIARKGKGFELELRSDWDAILVEIADGGDIDPVSLQNARIRVTGVGRGVLTVNQRVIFQKLKVASAKEVRLIDNTFISQSPLALVSISEVQSMPLEAARRALPVRVRGVVTDVQNSLFGRRMSIQDDTRGIYASLREVTNLDVSFGQLLDVVGHSAAGDFAPVIVVDNVTVLGEGRLPEPAHPTWTELLNGSMDVQWAEIQGLVTDVRSNTISLLLPEGRLEVFMDGCHESQLKPFEKSVVRIRGVLYAVWDAETREVTVGNVMFRNATINVDVPAPDNPFDAVERTPRELRLFDANGTAFRRVKVRGQVVYSDARQVFLEDDGAGIQLLPSENIDLQPGDLVEAVGYPDISRTSLLLREAILRKTGQAALQDSKEVTESELTQENLDSTLINIEGNLLGSHLERAVPVLEMQSGKYLYLARLAPRMSSQISLRAGSHLRIKGVYVSRIRSQRPYPDAESFDVLVNSPADIVVLSQPSWWTPSRLLIFTAVLLVVLAVAAIWITQLRRLVEQRTTQLRGEIEERERVEHQHELEAEKSRIARDLHDYLGSAITEIRVLASTGQRQISGETPQQGLFQSIAGKARNLISALDVIVWAVDPEDNSLQSLGDYLTGYAEEFFSNTETACRFKVPVSFPQITLNGRVRHELLLAVKETLNNIVRHANASEVEFCMGIVDGNLEIEIADNGKGFERGKDGHGLNNLSARLQKLGGTCVVESSIGGGTIVRIHWPLPGFSKAKTPSKNADVVV